MAIRSLKLSYNGEIRRFSLESLQIVEGHVSLDDLKQAARKTFSELKEMEFILSYQDEDNDIITIFTDSEVSEAFSVTNSLNSKVLRLEVSATKNSSATSNKAVHFRIICDGCGANPIIGDRFKCSVRDDYDLCAQCEALDNSLYPFLKIKTPAQSPAAIMTILKPNQASRSVSETSSIISDAMIEKINHTEELYNDEVVDMNEEPIVKKVEEKKQKPVGSCPIPSLVRLECLSSIREFGPFYAMRKPNNCMIFLHPSEEEAIKSERPWKSGKCLRLDNKTNGILMDGNGGPWASFHVENVKDASGGGGSSDVIRLVCGNRRLALCATAGKLGCCSSVDRGHHTHFKLHEASNVDEVDPIWDAMCVASSERAACPWDDVTPEEEKPFWEGMSASLINDVKAQMEQQQEHVVPPQAVLQASFVKDVTIPDGQNMQTGESFVKVWRLRNDTDVPFPEGVKLVHAGGAEMGQTSQIALNKEPIHPFEEFEVAVPMNAPPNPGKYASFWRLEFNGEKFGHQVWVEIMVVESPEKLMKAAQEEAEKLALAKMKFEQDEKESRILQEAARAQAEEALAIEAARMHAAEEACKQADEAARIQAEEEARKQAEEAALIQAEEEARKQAEEAALIQAEEEARKQAEATRKEAEQVEAERLEGERLLNMELESVLKAEEERIAVELEKAMSEVSEGPSSSADGNSIDWEHVDNVIDQDDEPSNQDLNDSVSSSDLYASDLSASIEGATLAGAALNEEAQEQVNTMTDSLAGLAPYLEDPSVVEWGSAVTRLMEMGFSDVSAIVKACQSQGCAPGEYETHLQAIVDRMLNSL